MSRRCGSGGNSHSFCAMYSLKMSVCRVPSSREMSTPWRSAATTYMQNTGTAGPLIVIDVVTSSSRMSANSTSMSAAESMATPQCPTSPSERDSSESRPIRVGMSKATDRPFPPASRIAWNRSLVSAALPKPANCRMVQALPRKPVGCRPRVNGYSPGQPIRSKPGIVRRRPVHRLDRLAGEAGELLGPQAAGLPRSVVRALPALPPGVQRVVLVVVQARPPTV